MASRGQASRLPSTAATSSSPSSRPTPTAASPSWPQTALSRAEQREALNAHPAIGARNLSERSAAEQGRGGHPAVLTELAYLNQVYEEKFGFRFVVFVDGRTKSEILEVLQQRLERTPEEELETGLHELVAIARSRWQK